MSGSTQPRPHIELSDIGRFAVTHGESGWQVAAPTTVQTVIRQLKRFVSMQAGRPVWQKFFHDHIIHHFNDHYRIAKYIDENPARWAEDCYYMQ